MVKEYLRDRQLKVVYKDMLNVENVECYIEDTYKDLLSDYCKYITNRRLCTELGMTEVKFNIPYEIIDEYLQMMPYSYFYCDELDTMMIIKSEVEDIFEHISSIYFSTVIESITNKL